MKLVLVRHTRVDLKTGICYGQSDLKPSKTFVSEANMIGEKLDSFHFDAIFTSPLQRCLWLTDHLDYMQATIDQRLMELNFGEWEMKPWNSIKGDYAEHWMEDYLHLPCPGGESMQDLIVRISDFYRTIKEKYDSVLIITHSGPIRAFHHLLHPEKFPSENLFEMKIDFGSVLVLS